MNGKLSKKQIILSQLMSIIFAIIQEVFTRTEIYFESPDCQFISFKVLTIVMIILAIIYSTIIYMCLEAKWINIILICLPFILYSSLFMKISPVLFPSKVNLTDDIIVLVRVVLMMYQWVGILIASFIGIHLHKIVEGKLDKINKI